MFGEKLRELRKSKDLTLRELAKELDISHSSLGKYERNERQPDYQILLKIRAYFNVSLDYLLGITDNLYVNETVPAIIPDELKELGVEYIALAKDIKRSKLTPEEIRELMEFAKKMKKK